jgi:multicomponent Na+:H+ antiporter subunit G
MSIAAATLMLLGSVFVMLAGLGTLRFADVYARMHPAAKGPTLGLILVSIGAALELRSLPVILALTLVVVLQFLAAPVGTHLLGRAVHQRLPMQIDTVDELAIDESGLDRSAERPESASGPDDPPRIGS